MHDFLNSTITLVGRPDRVSRKAIRAAVARTGGRLASTVTSRCGAVAVAHGAVPFLRDGRLLATVRAADRRGVPVISEHELLRSVRLLPPLPVDDRAFSAVELARRSGLDEASLRTIAWFDVIEPVGGRFGFRDLVVTRMVAELKNRGAELADIAAAGLQLRRLSGFQADLSRFRLTLGSDGSVLVLQDGQPVEPGGQIPLPLGLDNASFDDLADAAEQAEDDGDLQAAERLYRQALQIRRHDVVSLANLANILIGRGEWKEASGHLMRAVAADPAYADAWYNLGHIAQQEGDRASMRRHLERAIQARPDYADAIYNLAHLHFMVEAYEEAEPLWRRYLALDRTSKWAQTARRALKVCEIARMNINA